MENKTIKEKELDGVYDFLIEHGERQFSRSEFKRKMKRMRKTGGVGWSPEFLSGYIGAK